jgi:hypothetical protein
MEPSAWLALEAGHVPENVVQLRSIANALEINTEHLGPMLLICQDAWMK